MNIQHCLQHHVKDASFKLVRLKVIRINMKQEVQLKRFPKKNMNSWLSRQENSKIHFPRTHSVGAVNPPAFNIDIQQNLGSPTYPCPVCHRAYSRRRKAVQCTVCQQWLCLSQHCSGISRIRHYTPGGICHGCQPPTQPLTSSIPYSPVQTTRSTQT